jgi:hypothetical protein
VIRLRAALVVLLLLLPGTAVTALAGPAGAGAAAPRAAAAGAEDLYTVTGRVVRLANGRPVQGVRVTAYEVAPLEPRGAATTGAEGWFVIRGVRLKDSEVGVYVNGSRVGFRQGWVGCDKTLKPTWGAACSHSVAVGLIRITKA